MIVLNTKAIEFGDGDVCTGTVMRTDGVGVVYFTDLDKKYEIGERLEDKKDYLDQMLVSLHFKKTESIDVVIGALERIKKLMINEMEEGKC